MTGLRDRLAGSRSERPPEQRSAARARALLALIRALAAGTIRICMRYRVTGLAAEAGFFALLSLPPLVLGLVGSLGFVGEQLGTEVVADLRTQLTRLALTFLTRDSVSTIILPTFDSVVGGGRADIVSVGFLLSLWSGSRVLNVYLDTVTIMYGLSGHRGIVRTRVMSFSLYVAALLAGAVLIPLMLIGPGLLDRLLDRIGIGLLSRFDWVPFVYWPVLVIGLVALLTSLYHVATPVRSPWRWDVPGAVLALTIWLLASFVLRVVISHSVGGTSIYGPLATPIVVLIWLYFFAIAVLIGAALNAAIDERYPDAGRVRARERGPAFPDVPVTPVREVPAPGQTPQLPPQLPPPTAADPAIRRRRRGALRRVGRRRPPPGCAGGKSGDSRTARTYGRAGR